MSRTLKIGELEVPVPVIQGGMGVGVSLVSVLCLAGIAGFRYWKKRQEGDKDTEEDIRRKISEKRRAKA